MGVTFDRKTFFDLVRHEPFGGSLTQGQVDGMEFLLGAWEDDPMSDDLRHFAYMLATTFHETARTMLPIEEYGKGKGRKYGPPPDPETGQTYYGRGYVQLTWRENYARASKKLRLAGSPQDLEWYAQQALDPQIALGVMGRGMEEGWFTGKALPSYFNASKDDPFNARDIINPDKNRVVSGRKMGDIIADYHRDFLMALQAALVIEPEPPEPGFQVVHVSYKVPPGIHLSIDVNGEIVLAGVG